MSHIRRHLNTPAAVVVACWALLATVAAFAGNGITGYGQLTSSWDASAIVSPAATFGTLDTRTDKHLYDLDDTTDEFGLCRGVCPLGYNGSADFTLEVHWTAETATAGDALIFYAFERVAENDLDIDGASFGTQTNVQTTTNGTCGKINVSSFTVTNALADGIQPGDAFNLKTGRDADSSGTGTDGMNDDAEIFKVLIVWTP